MQPEMKQRSVEQNTFSPQKPKRKKKPLVILLAILAVVALGLAGWKWYGQIQEYKENKNDTERRIGQLEQELNQLKNAQKDDATDNSQNNSSGYLVLKEWGVRLKTSDPTVSYKIVSGDGYEVVYLTNAKIQALTGCKVTNENPEAGHLVAISRSKTEVEDAIGGAEYINRVGEYHYYVAGPQAACSEGSADQSIEVAQAAVLKNIARTVLIAE